MVEEQVYWQCGVIEVLIVFRGVLDLGWFFSWVFEFFYSVVIGMSYFLECVLVTVFQRDKINRVYIDIQEEIYQGIGLYDFGG